MISQEQIQLEIKKIQLAYNSLQGFINSNEKYGLTGSIPSFEEFIIKNIPSDVYERNKDYIKKLQNLKIKLVEELPKKQYQIIQLTNIRNILVDRLT